MTARGSDVNIKCENLVMRRWVQWAAERCAAIITVSEALATRLVSLGVAADNIHVLPNGVDLEKFRPLSSDPEQWDAPNGLVLLSVGHLLEGKGHHIVIEALKELPRATLLIVGEGPEQSALRKLCERLGLTSRVRFLGYVPHDQMAGVYSSADFTILASAHEGMPNVVLESLACGTRVIATAVGGIVEVITTDVAGSMMQERCAGAVADCVHGLTKRQHDRRDTREFAERFAWRDTIRKQVMLYERILQKSDGSVRVAADEIA
jgi:glycosyltransferase involved in cell wall biosynthesis